MMMKSLEEQLKIKGYTEKDIQKEDKKIQVEFDDLLFLKSDKVWLLHETFQEKEEKGEEKTGEKRNRCLKGF